MAANYVLLEKISVGAAGVSSVTFSNIPQTGYTDLVLQVSARSTESDNSSSLRVYFNSDTANITAREIRAIGSTAASYTVSYAQAGYVGALNSTANTFGSGTIHIPNYTSSNNKSSSGDIVLPSTTAAENYAVLSARLWSITSAVTSVTAAPSLGSWVQYSTFYLYGISALGTTPVIGAYATGGDVVTTDGTYWYHAFLASGTFTPRKSITADYAVIAGGAAGSIAGGAGAGGFRLASSQSLTATAYTATIGSGGSGLTNGNNGTSGKGNNSSFIGGAVSTTATGGGGGGAVNTQPGATGGSGGGGGSAAGGAGNQGAYSPVEGYAGGTGGSYVSPYMGGGGGGAGGAGGNSVGSVGGAGGIGTNAISTWLSALSSSMTGPWATATATGYIASGGAGGSYDGAGTSGAVSLGGGKAYVAGGGTAGTPNTGGGGGSTTGGSAAGNGGSGIVIVRYPV